MSDRTLSSRMRAFGGRWSRTALEERAHNDLRTRAERDMLNLARQGRDVCWLEAADEDEPLVTVRIATYNRGDLVATRAIASALAQTYERIEVLVVGDSCDSATAEAVTRVRDNRIRFVNLGHRGLYPSDPELRWHVAGSSPMNAATFLASGSWIAPCDDDDEFTPDHVETLLRAAKARRLEMVYGIAEMETRPGEWGSVGTWPLRAEQITHGSVLYSLGLRFMQHSDTSWRMRQPGDWNLWSRMHDAGVRIGHEPRVVYRHFLEARHSVRTHPLDHDGSPADD